MTGLEHLQQRIADGRRILGEHHAYVDGLCRASYTDVPLPAYSADRLLQGEFDRGFQEGRDILKAYPVTVPA